MRYRGTMACVTACYKWSIGCVIHAAHETAAQFAASRVCEVRVELPRLPGLNGYVLSRCFVNEFM